jgi:outer membrane immunogenic protein
MKKSILGLVAIGALIAGPAMAADLRMPVKAAPAPMAPVATWTGFYIGVNAGAVWSNDSVSGTPGPCSAVLGGCVAVPNYSTLMANALNQIGSGTQTSFIGGGQIGYNWQQNNLVFGLEADIQGVAGSARTGTIVTPSPAFPAFPLTTTFSDRLDYLGTVRGRIGFLATPQMLLYGTGGLAYGGTKTTITQSIAAPDPSIPAFASSSTTRAGFSVGGGVEWMLWSRWSAKAEFLYYDLGRQSLPLAVVSTAVPGAVTGSATANIRYTGEIARVGLNYHF